MTDRTMYTNALKYAALVGTVQSDLCSVEEEIISAMHWLSQGNRDRAKLHMDMALKLARDGQVREVESEAA